MRKLIPVEEAKALMREAIDWSLWGWLTEKRRLRTTADAAWEALEGCEREVKSGWSDDLKKAYRGKNGQGLDAELKVALEKMKEADEAWRNARETAAPESPASLAISRTPMGSVSAGGVG